MKTLSNATVGRMTYRWRFPPFPSLSRAGEMACVFLNTSVHKTIKRVVAFRPRAILHPSCLLVPCNKSRPAVPNPALSKPGLVLIGRLVSFGVVW